jgi:dGTPase
MFELLFKKYCADYQAGNETSDIYREFLDGMSDEYLKQTPVAGIVRDFIAGMTDEYFLNQCRKNLIPQPKTSLL